MQGSKVQPEPFVAYPQNQVFGVVSTLEETRATAADLESAGFESGALNILCCDEGIARIDLSGEVHGVFAKAVRWIQSVLGDEYQEAHQYREELTAGHAVIAVRVRDEGEKERAAEVLRHHGATSVNFYGKWLVEQLP